MRSCPRNAGRPAGPHRFALEGAEEAKAPARYTEGGRVMDSQLLTDPRTDGFSACLGIWIAAHCVRGLLPEPAPELYGWWSFPMCAVSLLIAASYWRGSDRMKRHRADTPKGGA